MPSQFSTLKIELIATGEQPGTWGFTTNNNIGGTSPGSRGLEQAIVGKADIITTDFTTNVYTMAYADTNDTQDFRAFVLNIVATLTGAGTINVPAIQKPYIVMNNSVGGFPVTVKVSGQPGVSVPNGAKVMVYNDGTDVGPAITHLTTLTLGTPLSPANGGTGITALGTGVSTALGQNVTGSGGIVLATSPTLITPNLGTPSGAILTNATQLPLTTGVTGTLPVGNGGTGVTTSTGSGSVVLSTSPTINSPTLVTPALGTPASGVLTNATGLPIDGGTIGTLPVSRGGTGLTSVPSNGQIDIGNGTGFTRTTLTAGPNISITYPSAGNITISATAGGTGTVTSVNTGAGLTGGPITTTGTISVATGGITNSLLRDSVSTSVIGRAGSTTGEPADIQAGTDHQVLRRSGSFLNFGAIRLDQSAAVAGQLPAANGGTGLSSPGTSGNVLVSNGTSWTSGVAPQTFKFIGSYSSGVINNQKIFVPFPSPNSGQRTYFLRFRRLYTSTGGGFSILSQFCLDSGGTLPITTLSYSYSTGAGSSVSGQTNIPIAGGNLVGDNSAYGLNGFLYVYKEQSGFRTSINGQVNFSNTVPNFLGIDIFGTCSDTSEFFSILFSATTTATLFGEIDLYEISR